MESTKELFGNFEGKEVYAYTLTNKNGMSIKIMEYGATMISLKVPTKNGGEKKENLVLGFDTLKEYIKDANYFGGTIGRYTNRICKGKFELNGVVYNLPINNGNNSLHGGFKGFDKVLWKTENVDGQKSIKVSYDSPDGDQGYPGNLKVMATYELSDENEIKLNYEAGTDKITPISMTNHSYFNLAGAGSGKIYDHQIMIFSEAFVELNSEMIPTGNIKNIKDTIYDLNRKKLGEKPFTIGDAIKSDPNFDGFDISYVIGDQPHNPMKKVVKVIEPTSGRQLEVFTTQPGIQLYSGNFLQKVPIADGKIADKHDGFCLESQNLPNAPNHKNFVNPFLEQGKKYHQETVYKFIF